MNKEKRYNYWQPLVYGALLSIGIIAGVALKPGTHSFITTGTGKIDELMNIINSNYVDTLNSKELQEDAINELLKTLDPHSAYIPAEDIQAVNEPLEGGFEGIGVEFNVLEDTIYVVSVIAGGPSDDAGLQPGDRIVTVDGDNVAGIEITNEKVIKLLKGPKNTKVEVGIVRVPDMKPVTFTITRGEIPYYSVEAKYMVNQKTGYIKLARFSATTIDEMEAALEELKEAGMQDLIFDLRGNPGGYLNAAIQVADEFIEGRKLLVYTQGRTQEKKVYKSGRRGLFEKGKLVILIDDHSASASEIVAGAVQDWDRGLIVGRRTFGKGLVQEPFQLSDNSVVRLTVSRYYTPTGRCIQKNYSNGYDEYQMEVYDRWENGEMDVLDSIKHIDSLKYTTPGGRTVYGGGGIYPDVFVAADTGYNRVLLTKIYSKNLQNRFVYSYLDQNRRSLKRYDSGKSFNEKFNWTEKDFAAFTALLQEAGIIWQGQDLEYSREIILNRMKALLARQLFNTNAYYMVTNSMDPVMDNALRNMDNYQSLLTHREK